MSRIKKIALYQFRNYNSGQFEFDLPVTCITGANGTGKTNLLDAIYYLCYTKSYFTSSQQNIAQNGKEGFRVEGVFIENDKNESIACKWLQGKKEISADGVEYEKPTDHIGKYAAVMIAPDDMELINDGSELRRKWVDSILGQVDRNYLECLMRYQRILLQRNAWLKHQATNPSTNSDELDFYNQQMVQDGSYIHDKRKDFIAAFLPLLQEFYKQLSGGKEQVHIGYESDLLQKTFKDLLKDSLQHDLRMQRTLKGIHKDDFAFVLNDTPIKSFGSQGQKKSLLFALKLAQYTYLSMQLGHLPILLLDDVFEKLDQQRMEALLRIIRAENFGQVVLTDTHAERVVSAFGNGADIGMIEL
ncbi:MAG: DNA replication and repair protein RecF [Bacteroidetes bacterium]|nr:DNA replication and repair protein RecF [Bacteroidota bacterium]